MKTIGSLSPLDTREDGTSIRRLATNNASQGLLGDVVARNIAQYVATATLKAGDVLPSEGVLAREFGVSTRVIREALRLLSEQGIVRTSQGRRAEVSDWRPLAMLRYFELARLRSRGASIELLELRLGLEPQAAAFAALRAQPADLQEAAHALSDMKAAGDDTTAWVSADVRFHRAVVNGAHNQVLSTIHDALADALLEERRLGVEGRLRQGRGPERTLREHASILRALAAHQSQLAEQRMLDHLKSSLTYFWGYVVDGETSFYVPSERKVRSRSVATQR